MTTASHSQMGKWRPGRASDLPKFAELVGDRVILCTQPVGSVSHNPLGLLTLCSASCDS